MKGWINACIGDVCKVIAGQSPEGKHYNTDGVGLPFYQGKKEFGDKFIGTPQVWTLKTTKEAQTGDVLMSVRAPVGSINFATNKICIGRGLAAIRPGDKVDRDFLFYGLLHKRSEIKGSEGAVFASINQEQIKKIEFPHPPLPEQKRIVAILDEAFEGIDRAIAHTKKNLTNARELFESSLNLQLFAVTSSEPTQKLLWITDLIVDCEHKTAPIQEGGIPSIRTPNIGKGYLIFENVNRVSEETYELWTKRSKPKPGDLILAREAPAGNVGVIPEGQRVCLGQRTVLIRPKEETVNSQYLAYLLLHPIMQTRLLAHSTGATVQHVNMKDIRQLPISDLPPIQAQIDCVRELEQAKLQINRLEAIYRRKLAALTELKQSILQKAFTGELTADTANQTIKNAEKAIAA